MRHPCRGARVLQPPREPRGDDALRELGIALCPQPGYLQLFGQEWDELRGKLMETNLVSTIFDRFLNYTVFENTNIRKHILYLSISNSNEQSNSSNEQSNSAKLDHATRLFLKLYSLYNLVKTKTS